MPNHAELRRDVVVIGASAGGLSVLKDIVSALPPGFPAAVLVVLHVGAHRSVLPEILSQRSALPAIHPVSGQTIEPGNIYVAPPDRHMLVKDGAICLTLGAKEHHARPAIDPLFRSVAISYGVRTIGVLLSGRLDDGTAGLQAIQERGGLVVVQDPADAEQPSMPDSACTHVKVDHCVARASLAETIIALAGLPAPPSRTIPTRLVCEQRISMGGDDPLEDLKEIGKPSTFGCPACDGVLWEISGSNPLRFRCHTGHGYSLRTLEDTQATNCDKSLWGALRALQEREGLLRAMAAASGERRDDAGAAQLELQADEVGSQWRLLQEFIVRV